MKLKKYFVSAALLLVSIHGYCCGPYWYYPSEYYLYRAWDGKSSKSDADKKKRNLGEWRTLCPRVPVKSIEEVVYNWDIEKLSSIIGKNYVRGDNMFARWISNRKDTEIVDYLVLMRQCELACANRADVWYYPFKDDPEINMLRSVIKRAREYNGKRLSERYTLQAVRAMFSLTEYDAICELWEEKKDEIQNGIIKDMIVGYVAGAELRRGNTDNCIDYYLNINDLNSVRYCLRVTGQDYSDKSLLTLIAERRPDGPDVPEILQNALYGFEDNFYHHSEQFNWLEFDYKKRMTAKRGDAQKNEDYLGICLKAIEKSNSPAVWLYSAAFLEDVNGNSQRASHYLTLAEKSNKETFLGESIKVMRIYLDSKLSTYDSTYEQNLFGQLKWLDAKIVSEINKDVREKTEEGYYQRTGFSYYYWNDMMRKILIGEVCPRMKDAGKGVLALRLMNMADNRLLGLVNSAKVSRYERIDGELQYSEKTMPLGEYRASGKYENEFDYSNYFFAYMDNIDLGVLRKYAALVGNSSAPFEQFLDERSYINKDYINEVIGTRYLRMRQYANAVKWLSIVSGNYQNTTNIKWYMRRDPFEYNGDKDKIQNGYKLSFAKEMASLEKKMAYKNPDVRGLAMVKYGTGLRSSFTNCWALTQYHKFEEDSWLEDSNTMSALKLSEELIRDGLQTIKDPEKATEAYFSQAFYITAAERFPKTKYMEEKFNQCPGLKDYK